METPIKSKIIDRAKNEVNGFNSMYEKLDQKVFSGDMSSFVLFNFGRCVATIVFT